MLEGKAAKQKSEIVVWLEGRSRNLNRKERNTAVNSMRICYDKESHIWATMSSS